MRFCQPIFLLLLCLFSFNAMGTINKWVDDNNQIHYSDQPAPANAKVTPLYAPTAAASDVSAQKTVAEREADYRKAQKAKDEADKQAAKLQEGANAKQKYCEGARIDLKTLENSPRISTYDSKGEISYMDDVERSRRIEEARKGISANCN